MSVSLPLFDDGAPPEAPDEAQQKHGLTDQHGRRFRDLRLSVTDRCNFRCIYCMEPDVRYMPKERLLTLEEHARVLRIVIPMGIEKIRITGGEATMYPHLDDLIEEIGCHGLDDLAMTTNGSQLTADRARRWKDAGLNRLTISLDSLKPDRCRRITRSKTSLDRTLSAIDIAIDAGLAPVKVNVVVIRGINDDELPDFADFARDRGVDLRLLEFMPLDAAGDWSRDTLVPADEMVAAVAARHELIEEPRDHPASTSVNYRFKDGAGGRLGIVAPVSRPFCGDCDRLRITADGGVRPCLFSHEEWSLRPLLRGGASDADVVRFIVDAAWAKQEGHGIDAADFERPQRSMHMIGG